MAKKRKDETEQKMEEAEQMAPDASPVEEETDVHYTRGTWAGFEQFCCKHCEFDTLELGVMAEHLFWMHSILFEINPKEN